MKIGRNGIEGQRTAGSRPRPRTGARARARVAREAIAAAALTGGAAWGQSSTDLARFFGFDSPRVVVVDDGAGPVIGADLNGDSRNDLICVNNRKSRIEVFLQRESPRTEEEQERDFKVNELPPSPWYDRKEISVAHQVQGIRAHDVDADGRLDLVYAGSPAEIVILRQSAPMTFEPMSKRRVRGLAATRTAFTIADVTGDTRVELLAAVNGKIGVFPLSSSGTIGDPVELGSGAQSEEIIAFFTEDYDGDGMTDVLGVIPDAPAPLRLWRQQAERLSGVGARSNVVGEARAASKSGRIGPEVRFEMPALREAEPIRFDGRPAASIGVIERASRRMVFYDLTVTDVATGGASPGSEREAQAEVYSFSGASGADRSVAVADVDADGRLDLLATDKGSNLIVLHRQGPDGMGVGEPFSAFKDPKAVAAGQWDGQGPLEVFVLSEEEKTLGVSTYDAASRRLTFPQPIQIATPGGTPVAMSYVTLADGPAVAVVVKDKRDHTLEIHRPAGPGGAAPAARTIAMEGIKRPPQAIKPADIDHDGDVDLLLFTPGEPMVVIRIDSSGAPTDMLTDKTMPQFGLVQAAGPDNTLLQDVNADGRPELVIASKNFVRACAYDAGAGWRVIDQITLPDASTDFVGLAAMQPGAGSDAVTLVAADKANGRVVMMAPERGAWRVVDTLRLPGFPLSSIHAGAFTGDDRPGLLVVGSDAFGVIRLAGRRAALESFAAWRPSDEKRLEHEMTAGDLNGDGYTDVAVLDAREQMCSIFTFSASRKLHLATEFEVFQSRLFNQGESREFQPSDALIMDVTGDGGDDLVLVVHDRLMIYPQMTAPR